MGKMENENLKKAIEYLKNEETVSITKYGDVFYIITGKEKILLWAKENEAPEN